MNIWGRNAKTHWQNHRNSDYLALTNPDEFFTTLGEEAAARYLVIRDSLLDGLSPNEPQGIGWAEYQDKVAQADQQATEIVETEMIYLPASNSRQQ